MGGGSLGVGAGSGKMEEDALGGQARVSVSWLSGHTQRVRARGRSW